MNTSSSTYVLGPIQVRSPIPLPFSSITTDVVDVELKLVDQIPEVPPGATSIPLVSWLDSHMWINHTGHIQAYIHDGTNISMVVPPEIRTADIRGDLLVVPQLRFALVLTFSALLVQRGMLLLHAAATSLGGITRVYLGRSGSGKSTAALFDSLRGGMVLADDVVPIFIDHEGIARTFQFDPLSAIESQPAPAVAWIGQSVSDCVGTRTDGKKLFKPSVVDSCTTFPLHEVACLDPSKHAGQESSLTRMPLLLNILEQLIAASLNQAYLREQHLHVASIIAKQVRQVTWSPERLHMPFGKHDS